jgi:hypothetical protein
MEGETVCTYSTVHGGRVSSHLMYRIPRQRKHSTGIQFEAIDATESLKLIEPIVAELGYTGQISFDFLVTEDGLTFVECNPRATDGLLLMPREELAAGLLDPRPETFVLAPGGQPSPSWPTASLISWNACPVDRRPRAGPGRRQRLARPSAHAVLCAGYLPLRRAELPRAHRPNRGHRRRYELGRRAHRRNVRGRRDAAHRPEPAAGRTVGARLHLPKRRRELDMNVASPAPADAGNSTGSSDPLHPTSRSDYTKSARGANASLTPSPPRSGRGAF